MSNLWLSIQQRRDRPRPWLLVIERHGQRTTRSFTSFEEAKAAERDLRKAEKAGQLAARARPPKITLATLGEDFLRSKRSEGAAEATLSVYRALLMASAVPSLGADRHPRTVTAQEVEAFRDKRLQEVSPTTVVRELDRIRALLGYAKKKGLVGINVADQVKFPRIPKKSYDWLRAPELGPFLEACQGEFAMIAKVAIFTGLRRREVVFLQCSDVDLRNNVVSVRSKRHLGFRPKSGKDRSVPIDPVLRPALVKHLEEQVGPGPDAWVFPRIQGSRRSAKTRWFALSTQAAAERAGIHRRLTFHDLRRTYGAMLIEAGVEIYTVSRLLGHADVRITHEDSAPLSGRNLAEQAAKLGRHIGPSLVREVPSVPSLKTAAGSVDP
jgi:integrase